MPPTSMFIIMTEVLMDLERFELPPSPLHKQGAVYWMRYREVCVCLAVVIGKTWVSLSSPVRGRWCRRPRDERASESPIGFSPRPQSSVGLDTHTHVVQCTSSSVLHQVIVCNRYPSQPIIKRSVEDSIVLNVGSGLSEITIVEVRTFSNDDIHVVGDDVVRDPSCRLEPCTREL